MNKSKIYPFYFVLGALLLYSLLYVLPSFIGIGYSFTDWTAFSNEVNFVGLKNFIKLGSSSENYLIYLKGAQEKGKPIFTVDYALEPQNVAWIYQTSRNLGFIPFVSERNLSTYFPPYPQQLLESFLNYPEMG